MCRFSTLIAIALSLPLFSLSADEYHYKNILNGAKAAGLGGAYISVADDLTAMLYNPAGLSRSTVESTASMNVLSWEKTEFSNVFSDRSDFVRDSFIVVPGFFGFRAKREAWDFGISFAVTDFSKERTSKDVIIESPNLTNNEFIFIDLDNSAYKFGGSFAFQYNEFLSFGASLFLQYKEFTSVQGSGIASTIAFEGNTIEAGFNASRRITDTHVTLQPILGMLWHKNNFSVGAKLSYEYALRRDYDVTSTIYVASTLPLPNQISPISRISNSNNIKQKFPIEVGLGASYQWANLLISADINYFTKVNSDYNTIAQIETPITRPLEQTVNLSAGIEYAFSKDTAIRFGIFTDNANSQIDTSVDFQRVEEIDHIGFSTSIKTSVFKKQLTFGFYYKQGKGKVRFADIRAVENIVGIPLYPENENYDIANAKKQALVIFLSLDF